MTSPFELTGRTILVTGASSGIGRACAVFCSEIGARVVLMGRKEDALQETLSLMKHQEHHMMVPFDLMQTDLIESSLQKIVQVTGLLDGFVHCAGIHMARPLKMLSAHHIDQMITVNVTTGILLAKSFRLKHISSRPASLVFLGSVVALVGQTAITPYALTKGALLAATKSLAVELAPEQIRVNIVLPGVINTPMSERLFEQMGETQLETIKSAHLLGFGEPQDVAHAAAYLLSPASRWVTGTSLIIDGGYTAQ